MTAQPIDPTSLCIESPNLTAEIASGDVIDVRTFEVEEALSSPFSVRLLVVSPSAHIDFTAVIGKPASFTINRTSDAGPSRTWSGSPTPSTGGRN